jgi:ABC-type molybdenum transport system ATPase subunit/photorepair protein PhrA
MIESIKIEKGVASFCDDDAILDKLSSNNFIYGSNGSGKTTISRIIAEEHRYPGCSVQCFYFKLVTFKILPHV